MGGLFVVSHFEFSALRGKPIHICLPYRSMLKSDDD